MSHDTNIIVNGTNMKVDGSKMLIEVLHQNSVEVPHFCYHEALGVDGNCRMCMVDIKGQKRPQIACNTPIKEGMEVSTTSEMIMGVKRDILELELINHPVDCPICDQAGECSLQEYYMDVGLHESRVDIAHKTKKQKHVDLGANVILDQERCVLCTRCTRFTEKITKTHDLVVANRGNHACITTFSDTPLEAKGYAMNVVDLCPVGALTSKDFRFSQRVWFLKTDEAICQGCATGCNIYIDHNGPKYEDDTVWRFRPRKNESVNGHFMCDEGRLSYKHLNENRLFTTDIGNHASLSKIKKLIHENKGSICAMVSASLSLEELMAIKLFALRFNIILYASETSTIDKEFRDDMLKCEDKSSNRNGLKLMHFNQNKPPLENLEKTHLIFNFDNSDFFVENDTEIQTWIHFTSHKQATKSMCFPIPAYHEKEGSIINKNFHLQKFTSTVRHPLKNLSLQESLAILTEDEALNSKAYLWSELASNHKSFKNISFDNIPLDGMIIEEML